LVNKLNGLSNTHTHTFISFHLEENDQFSSVPKNVDRENSILLTTYSTKIGEKKISEPEEIFNV